MVKVTARRKPGERQGVGYAHEVEIEGGHTLIADEPPAAGGTDAGPSPTRLLAASLASCTAITMEMYARRKEWDLGAAAVDVDVEYDGYTPAAFSVSLHLPAGLDEEQRQRLVAVARKCPVHNVIANGAAVTVSERVEDR